MQLSINRFSFTLCMFLRHYETSAFTIEMFLTNKSPNISFDKCFEMNVTDMLPKQFIVRNNLVFCRKKIPTFENCLTKLNIKGKVDFLDLKRLLPTVFDFKQINQIIEREFVEQNKEKIIEITEKVIGKEKVEAILERK